MPKKSRITLGAFEKVRFPQLGGIEVLAKIDTGAYLGALHCRKVYVEGTKDSKVLHFVPFDNPETEIITADFFKKRVKSSNGVAQNRYVITTTIVIKGKTYDISISLADRSEMRWPVLIGRKFLRTNLFLVDVNRARK